MPQPLEMCDSTQPKCCRHWALNVSQDSNVCQESAISWYQPKAHGPLDMAPLVEVKGDVFHPTCTLNEGKYATTYCMRNSGEDRLVARVSYDADDWSNTRLSMEILSGTSSLFVCLPFLAREVLLQGSSGPRVFLHVLTFCPGGDLLDFHAERRHCGQVVTEQEMFPWTCQLVEAVSYLHEHHIFHCDVKLSNILIDAEGSLRLTDFGCARRGIPNGHTVYSCPQWARYENHLGHMPPETFMEDRERVYDHTLDWYQIGACLYNLLENHRPLSNFQNCPKGPELWQNLRKEMLRPSRADISSNLRNFVSWLLHGERVLRLGAGSDLQEVWQHEFLSNNPALVSCCGQVNEIRQEVRRSARPGLQSLIRPLRNLGCSRCQPELNTDSTSGASSLATALSGYSI